MTLLNSAAYPLNNSGKVVVNANSSLLLERTDKVSYSVASTVGNIDVYGTLTAKYNAAASDPNGYNLSVSTGKTMNVFSGAKVVYNNGAMHVAGGTINLYDGSKTTVNKIVFSGGGNGKLVLKGDNVISNSEGTPVNNITIGSYITGGRIDASATKNIEFNILTIQNDASFGFVLSSKKDALLSINKFQLNLSNTYTNKEKFVLDNFHNDVFKITDTSNIFIADTDKLNITQGTKSTLASIIATDSEGKTIGLSENQTWSITDAGFLNIVTIIPEPAQWAAIFGGLALAATFFRRRK